MMTMNYSKFHPHHGSNIELYNNQTTAKRSSSFANALTFSERPLAHGEIFLIEIEENETGWSGHMRIGLTQMNPNDHFKLPLYALPDLVSMGPSWLFAITKTHNQPPAGLYDSVPAAPAPNTTPIVTTTSTPNATDRSRALPARYHHLGSGDNADTAQADLGNNNSPASVIQDEIQVQELAELLQIDPARLREDQGIRGAQIVPRENVDSEDSDSTFSASSEIEAGEEPSAWVLPMSRPSTPNALPPATNPEHGHTARISNIFNRDGVLMRTQSKLLMPLLTEDGTAQDLLPTDVGSRIGVMYNITGENQADMHFIINGIDNGPCAREIPTDKPLYAVIDVYGSTKRVKIIQLYGVESLQSICREVILESIHSSSVKKLPLPGLLQNYLIS